MLGAICRRVQLNYRISRPIRRTVIFSLEILQKNNDECILILVIYSEEGLGSKRAVVPMVMMMNLLEENKFVTYQN